MTASGLRAERCEPCSESTQRLSDAEIDDLRSQLHPDWTLTGDPPRLYREMRFPDFAGAFAMATRLALLAESQGHHPDLAVGWGRLSVEIVTHAVGGLTRTDMVLAAQVDAAAESR